MLTMQSCNVRYQWLNSRRQRQLWSTWKAGKQVNQPVLLLNCWGLGVRVAWSLWQRFLWDCFKISYWTTGCWAYWYQFIKEKVAASIVTLTEVLNCWNMFLSNIEGFWIREWGKLQIWTKCIMVLCLVEEQSTKSCVI